jgi:hypothetical protein
MDPVIAYVDPGVGATILQVVLAGTVGIGALIKLRWRSIKRAFGEEDAPDVAAERVDDSPR